MSDIAAIVLADLRDKTACVMEAVRAENPAHWPAGLHVGMFADVHPVITSNKLAGFVGWQVIDHPAGYKAGYYSVGILPEFRRQGLAKKACERLIAQHKGEVAQVRALIVDGNAASEKLAACLGAEIDRHDPREKEASALKQILGRLGKVGLGAGVGAGVGELENRTTLSDLSDKNKHLNSLLNILAGTGVGAAHGTPHFLQTLIGTTAGGLPLKEMALGAKDTFEKNAPLEHATALTNLEAAKAKAEESKTLLEQAKTWSPSTKLLAGALGLGGLGLGLYGYNSLKGKPAPKATTKLQSDPALRHKSKLRIDIPADAVGKDFYDQLVGLTGKHPADASFTAPAPEAA